MCRRHKRQEVSKTNILKAVKDFFKECPLLDNGIIRAEYFGDKYDEYTIEVIPSNPVVKYYIDGSSERQFTFAFGSREYYGEDDIENINNSGFYEELAGWLEKMSMEDKLPKLGEGKSARNIEAITPGYIYNAYGDSARYQIQCRLTYFQEAV